MCTFDWMGFHRDAAIDDLRASQYRSILEPLALRQYAGALEKCGHANTVVCPAQ